MTGAIDTTAWSSLMLGLAALFAGVGALRRPGMWKLMIEEIDRSPALQLLCGFVEMVAGALIYFANPWLPADLLACIVKGLGGAMILEAVAILGFGDLYPHFWLRSLSHFSRGWPLATIALGLALCVAGAMRFH